MKKLIWLSYDLGIKGDYGNLYSWLDAGKAKECGYNTATLSYQFEKDLIQELFDEIKSNIQLKNGDRIYVIYKDNGKMKGKFIVGKRKPSPWEGYAVDYDIEVDTDEE